MRVMIVHNRYRHPGGEDRVVAEETALLRARGHEVVTVEASNDGVGAISRARLAARTVWSGEAYGRVRGLCRRTRPDVVHVHNTLAMLSPSVFHAARAEGIATVHTLHNYRMVCPSGLMYRDGAPCEDCLGRGGTARAVWHGCYRGSRAATAVVAATVRGHAAIGTWSRVVDRYIALTGFARDRFVEGGLPIDRITVRPNYVASDPGTGRHQGGHALFVGRLTPEKGIGTLLEAWRRLGPTGLRLRIAGSGPIDPVEVPGVEWLGAIGRERVIREMQDAAFLVFPSEWYEGFPMTLVEAYATGLPVIGSRIGSVREIVDDGATGLQFEPGDAADLAARARWAFAQPITLRMMGREARLRYERLYSSGAAYDSLLGVYEQARERADARSAGAAAPAAAPALG